MEKEKFLRNDTLENEKYVGKNNNEKRHIPGTSPDWNLELPDGDANSLVTKDGKNWDNSYNFDERIDDEPEAKTTFENIAEG